MENETMTTKTKVIRKLSAMDAYLDGTTNYIY